MRGQGQGRGRRWRRQGCSRRAVRFLEPVLLLLLHHRPAHGYTFLEQLKDLGLGDTDPSVVYRALRDMEEKEWVTSKWDEEQSQGPPRRVYSLTPLGDDVLRWWLQDLRGTRKMIDDVLELYERHMADEGQHDHGGNIAEATE